MNVSNPGWFSDITETDNQRAALRHAIGAGDISRAVDLFAAGIGCFLSAGLLDEARDTLEALRDLTQHHNTDDHDKLTMCAMGVAELTGDFTRSHALAEQIRGEDRDIHQWCAASAIVVHHLAAPSPRHASIVLEEFETRTGVVPLSSYLRAEIALGEARFADAADAIYSAFGVDGVEGLARTATTRENTDAVILVDLAIALRVLGLEEAEVIVDVLAEVALPYFGAYVPLIRAVVGCGSVIVETTIADLRMAQPLLRQFAPPLGDRDAVVSGAFIASELGRYEVAAEALAITHGMPQRTLSAFGLRRHLQPRLRGELGDEGWQAAVVAGTGRTPDAVFDWLIQELER
jgi:hypothetical protein